TKEWPLLETELEKGGGYLPEASRQAVSEAMEELLRLAQGSPADASEPPTSDGNGTASAEVTPAEERISPEAVAGGLTRALEHGGTFPAPEELCDQLVAMVESAWLEFLEHVRVAGTFMRSSPPSDSVPRAEERARAQDKACEAWIQWHRTAPNRLVLSIHLLRLMEGIAETREELVTGAAETVLLPLTEARESSRRAFRALAERAEKAFSQPKDSQDPAVLSDEVTGLLTEGLGVLDGSWGGFLTPDGIEDSIHALADGASTGLAGRLTILPDTISVQAVHSDDVALSPTKELQDVNLRETVRQVLDVLRLEKVRTAPEPLLDVLLSTREEVAGLPEALRFNLEAALDELTAPEDGSVTEEDMGEAASLTREGLARTEESLSRLLAGLSEGWQALLDRTDEILGSAFREIHGRLTADKGVQQQLGGIRDRVSHWFRTSSHEARIALGRVEKRARRTVKKWSVQALRAVRLGQAVVGTTPTEAGGGDRALSLIRQAPEVLAGLPLIYRRLFSFEPLTEGSLLKGRSEEEAWVRARFDSWGRGLCGPALLTGPVGAGHTSFFNVLSTSVFPETRLHRLELMDRVRSEDALTSLLWRAFEFDGDPPPSLADLGNSIRARASRGKPWVILIERLEHVFLRTPGGTDLFEDFLSLQAQTAGSVFWLSSMSGAAWKLVAKTEPRAASLVQVHPLTPPTRPELEELILARHGRSGLPIEFHPPSDLNPLVRRRLRRSRGEKAHQNILQTEFFDRLFRVSQDSIPLAILYWLRSTDFRSSEGKLFLTPPAEIRYSFLDNLDLELEFALKAFLEHGSLTLSEYQEVFAATPDEAVQTFEALRARLLLEPSGGDEGPLEHSEKRVEDKVGYRIPSLLSQVVARHLKNRNILH
ncbi:MAG: hypothetical protein KJN92_09145, partial [Gemmatimonadetes bacterium]|nr:hypothetical protein [Gemmatimonadota bacterium]